MVFPWGSQGVPMGVRGLQSPLRYMRPADDDDGFKLVLQDICFQRD